MPLQLPPSPSKSHAPSAWSYFSSFRWVRPVAMLAVLYSVALFLLLTLFWRLPSTDTLSSRAHLQGSHHISLLAAACTPCLCKLVTCCMYLMLVTCCMCPMPVLHVQNTHVCRVQIIILYHTVQSHSWLRSDHTCHPLGWQSCLRFTCVLFGALEAWLVCPDS